DTGWTLVGRHAFDFARRLGSVVASGPEGTILIAKGAPEAILALCTSSQGGGAMGAAERAAALAQVTALAGQEGLRTIAVASRAWTGPA
ncbi:magnesium-translocating P-type ATPase, partial [Pseudomonas sp. FW305-33]